MFKCLQSMNSISKCRKPGHTSYKFFYVHTVRVEVYRTAIILIYVLLCVCETHNSLIIFTSAYNSKHCQPNYPFQISWLYSPLISHSLITVSLRNSSNYYINNCDGQISIYPLVYKKHKNFIFMCISRETLNNELP